jgi:threonine aldolase
VPDAPGVVARCRERDLLVGALDRTHLRAVTHLDVGDDDVDRAAQVLVEVLRR